MNLPMKLVEFRQSNKLSQEDLAAKLGVSRQSVSKWEQGISFPETDKLIELSNMMGVSIDSLLKGDAPPTPYPEPQSFFRRNWLLILLACLLAVTTLALVIRFPQDNTEPHPSTEATNVTESTEPSTEPTSPTVESTEPTETAPEDAPLPDVLNNEDLSKLREWFFDFARRWRLDYMPQFTVEDGAPTDAGEYLYWCSAIHADEQGTALGEMSKDFVEETVLLYFSTPVSQHRSHIKQWNYDPDAELYTAYPDGLKAQRYYQLNAIEVLGNRTFTVHGACYYTTTYGFPQELEDTIQNTLFEGGEIATATTIHSGDHSAKLVPIAHFSLTFNLDHVFSQPRFHALEVTMLTDTVRW